MVNKMMSISLAQGEPTGLVLFDMTLLLCQHSYNYFCINEIKTHI